MLARVYLSIERSSHFKCLFISFFVVILFRNCLFLFVFFILHLFAFKEPNLDLILGPFPSQFRLISAGPIASPTALKPSCSSFFAWLPCHAPAWPPRPVPSACSFSHLQFPCSWTVAALHPTPSFHAPALRC